MSRCNRPEQAPQGTGWIPREYVEAYTFRAADLCQAGDVPGALVALGKALERDPGYDAALVLRGALELHQGHPRKAVRDFSRALDRNGRNTAAYYKRGEAQETMGHLRAAIADFSRVLLLEGDHREALLHRAVLYSRVHQKDRALADFKSLMNSDPRVARALANWGVLRFLERGVTRGNEERT